MSAGAHKGRPYNADSRSRICRSIIGMLTKQKSPVTASGARALITLGPQHKTVWYEVEIQRP